MHKRILHVFAFWFSKINNNIYIQYWCIDGKNRIDVARLRNEEKNKL